MLHLFHPALLHFSVAFVTVGGVCEIVGRLSGREACSRFGGLLLLIAAAVAVTLWGAWLGGQMVYVEGVGVR